MVLEAYMYVSCELRRCLHPQSLREVQTLLRTRLVASYQPLLWCKVAVSTRTWPVGNSKPTNIEVPPEIQTINRPTESPSKDCICFRKCSSCASYEAQTIIINENMIGLHLDLNT